MCPPLQVRQGPLTVLITPMLALGPRSPGRPTASIRWPTLNEEGSPSSAVGNSTPWNLSTAKSVLASRPPSVAGTVRPFGRMRLNLPHA